MHIDYLLLLGAQLITFRKIFADSDKNSYIRSQDNIQIRKKRWLLFPQTGDIVQVYFRI